MPPARCGRRLVAIAMIYANLLPRLTWVLLLPMAFAQTCPRGWQASPDGKVGVQAFQPKELAVGELLRVQFGKRQRLEGRPLEVWLGAELAAEQSRKAARDVLLDEAARIMGDVVELTKSGTAVASKRTAGVATGP